MGEVSDSTSVSHLKSREVPGGESWHTRPVAQLRAALSAANITASEKRVKRLKAAAAAPPAAAPAPAAVAAAPRAAASASLVLIAGSQTGADRDNLFGPGKRLADVVRPNCFFVQQAWKGVVDASEVVDAAPPKKTFLEYVSRD